jgi:hypothetical protein
MPKERHTQRGGRRKRRRGGAKKWKHRQLSTSASKI